MKQIKGHTKTRPLSKEAVIAGLKKDALTERGHELSDPEAEKEYEFIQLAAKIFVSHCMEEARLLRKLKDIPEGFPYDKEGHHCAICDEITFGENSWYDKYGLKCMTCQDAINKKIIPASIAKNRNSYYTDTGLEVSFNMTHHK